MLKSITFSNMFIFADEQTIDFNSKVQSYSIFGSNGSGKSCLLDIIECVTHSFWDKPNYTQLLKVVNHNTSSPIISSSCIFEYNGIDYQYSIEIDTEKQQYLSQKLKLTKSNKYLFNLCDDNLSSDYLTELQVQLLKNMKIKRYGVLAYIDNLERDDNIAIIKDIRNLAKEQDYIKITGDDLTDGNLKLLVKFLNDCNIPVRDIQVIQYDDKIEKRVQETRQDRHLPTTIQKKEYSIKLFYDNYSISLDEEASGIIKLVELGLETLVSSNRNYFFPRVIDNLDEKLHEDIFIYLLETFISTNVRQLIFTTQNQSILEHKLLPRASIIIVNRDSLNSSITKLSDFKLLRSDERHNWKNMYEMGKFGGIPRINNYSRKK